MKKTKKQVTLYVDGDVYEKIKEFANKSEYLSIGAIVRLALKRELKLIEELGDDYIKKAMEVER